MARNNRHNAAFVVGSVVGAVAGAAVALWKTPLTGEELRSKLTGAGSHEDIGAQAYRAPASTGTTASAHAGEERSIKDKVLAGVEKTLAPIVGVELGKTANGSGSTTLESGEIKVSPEYGTTLLRHPHAWHDGSEAAASGDVKIGLSRDKVDAEKWAAAYGTSADTTATTPSTPAAPATPPVEPVKTETASPEYGTTLLRHPHAWHDGAEAETGSGAGNEKIGLSMDKVNSEEWAAAYDTPADTTDTTPATPATGDAGSASGRLRPQRSWGASSSDTSASGSESEKIGLSVDRVNAEEWAAAYGTEATTSSTGTSSRNEYASKAAESEAQTGLGAKPAYPGSDQTGHEPLDRAAPDSNVAEVSRRDDNIRTDSGLTAEDAASIESLTKPQIDRIPDSMRTPDEGSYHPFPKLGGKEN